MSFVEKRILNKITGIPDGAVIIKENAGIYAVSMFDKNGVTPWTGRIISSDNVIISSCLTAFGDKSVDDIEFSLVVPNRRRPESK